MLDLILHHSALLSVASYLNVGGNLMEIKLLLVLNKHCRKLILNNELFWMWYLSNIYKSTKCLIQTCREAKNFENNESWLQFCKAGVAQRKLKRQWRFKYSGRIIDSKNAIWTHGGKLEIADKRKIYAVLNDFIAVTQEHHSIKNMCRESFQYQLSNIPKLRSNTIPRVKQWWTQLHIVPYSSSQNDSKNNYSLKDIRKTIFGSSRDMSGIEINPYTHSLYIPHSAMYYDSMPRHFQDVTRHPSYRSPLSGPQKEMVCILKDMIESVGAELPIPALNMPSKSCNGTSTTTTAWQSVLKFFFQKRRNLEAHESDSSSSNGEQESGDGIDSRDDESVNHPGNGDRTAHINVQPDVLWFGTKVRHQGEVRIFLAAMRPMMMNAEPVKGPETTYPQRQYLPTIQEEESSATHGNQLTYGKRANSSATAIMRVSMISFVPVSSHAVVAGTTEHPLTPIADLL